MNEFLTRVGLKIDTLANWTAEANQFVLLNGEVAFATIASAAGKELAEPVIMMKIGDGTKTFNQLDWAFHAKASDVYGWAKKAKLDAADLPDEAELDTRYSFEIPTEGADAGKLVVYATLYTKGVAGTPAKVAALDFVTPGELEDILADYVESVDSVDTVIKADNTDKQNPKLSLNITANQGNVLLTKETDGLKANVDLSAYALKNELANTVTKVEEGAGIDVAVTGEDTANPIYTVSHEDTSDAVNLTAADRTYVTGLTFDDFGHVTGYTTAPETVVDTNTAHTHSAGDGLIIKDNAVGGIDGNVEYQLNLGLKLEDGNIILHDKDNNAVIATLEADELLEDSYLNDVEIKGNELQFTWKMDDGSTKTDSVDLTHLVDVYKGDTTDTIKVTVENYKIKADLLENSVEAKHLEADSVTTAKIADKNVTEEKLSDAVTAKLNKEWQPIGDYKTIQEKKEYTGSTIKTIINLEQDINGVITKCDFEDIAFPQDPKASGSAAIASAVDGVVTIKGGAELSADHVLSNSAAADVVLDKIATTGSTDDLKQGSKLIIFNCGGATTNVTTPNAASLI